MSKRALAHYGATLKKKELEALLLDLYQRFPVVKEYFDFVFNPKEEKLLQEAKLKISNEYFPAKRKKPKARRSVAQKYIKHFMTLGVEAHLIADLMLYNIEIAQSYAMDRNVPESFYKSILTSFGSAVKYLTHNGIVADFKERILKCERTALLQNWPNWEEFSRVLDILD